MSTLIPKMSKLFIIVGLLVAVCQGDESNGATTRGIDYWCSRDGYQPFPTDPHKYFQCEWIPGTGWYIHMRQCPQQTTWVQSHKKCELSIDSQCAKDGYVAHPTDPHEFYLCEKTAQGWSLHLMHCPQQTTWVQSRKLCELTPQPTTQSPIDYWCSRDGYMSDPTDSHKYFQCEYIPGQGWYLHLQKCPQQTTWVQSHKLCELTPQPTTQSPIDIQCSRDGYVPNPDDPHEFFQCEWIPGTGWYLHLQKCPQQTTWVQSHRKCEGQ
ncbi:unnamed protein product [Oppiella nova]|uniref:Chitin-binding type-2 domain-containing protein n=1 Tax=Oppiella nova TaxID=334625 RepID=A0A7R9LTI4_9ACAR|nr:unnamed protein product [Oppiella nova]CAG2166820.1 unnamed protein product [Oppiella nova]